MKTYSDEIIYLGSKVHREGIVLAGCDHSAADFKALLTTLGSSVEVFLKDHVYTGTRNKRRSLHSSIHVVLVDANFQRNEFTGRTRDLRQIRRALKIVFGTNWNKTAV